jgi:hypothetical protein
MRTELFSFLSGAICELRIFRKKQGKQCSGKKELVMAGFQ